MHCGIPQRTRSQPGRRCPAAQAHQRAAPSGTSLFADAPRPVSVGTPGQPVGEAPRPSLFSTVTGAFKRRNQPMSASPPAAAPAQVQTRTEPVIHETRHEQPRALVQQTGGEEVTGLDIPAFLRRQSS